MSGAITKTIMSGVASSALVVFLAKAYIDKTMQDFNELIDDMQNAQVEIKVLNVIVQDLNEDIREIKRKLDEMDQK